MIDYFKGIYGTNLLRRVHGSALYRGSLVGLLSVVVYLLIALRWNDDTGDDRHRRHRYYTGHGGHHHYRDDENEGDLNDPYGVGVLVSSVTFLVVFRANTGYQRYWEACHHLHHLLSKMSDATMTTATFHLQSRNYDGARPPPTTRAAAAAVDAVVDFRRRDGGRRSEADRRPDRPIPADDRGGGRRNAGGSRGGDGDDDDGDDGGGRSRAFPTYARGASPASAASRVELHSRIFPSSRAVVDAAGRRVNFACRRRRNDDGDDDVGTTTTTPPLFLQELAHLSSLACAVALSTLRNDESVSRYESPLGTAYAPGSEWPSVDPDCMTREGRDDFQHRCHLLTLVMYWLGLDRLPRWRARYNAARPLPVLGGASDSEVMMLRRARGSHAKTELAFSWLREFVIRESLAGSLGTVHASIISRVIQNFSDAAAGYHQARKISYVPFPFPHAQLCSFFTLVMVFALPFLMDQYASSVWVGTSLSFLSATCLVGLHEVARELENPFRNAPNEIPLCALAASYNETLVTMFGGYHPDELLWEDPAGGCWGGGGGKDRGNDDRDAMVVIRNTTTTTTTMSTARTRTEEEMRTTDAPEPMTTTSSSSSVAMDCPPTNDGHENEYDRRRTFPTTARVVDNNMDAADYCAAKELLENTLARQATEVEELRRLLDRSEEHDEEDECDGE